MSQKTSLYQEHVQANAQMIEFYGWHMPLHYGSQLTEHHQVRRDAGLFDVSHMTIVDLLGAGGRQFLRYLLSNDVDKLSYPGKALYSCMLNQHGGIIDDLIVYLRSSDNYRLVFNAATHQRVLEWLKQQQAEGLSIGIQECSELAMLAIQGPNAMKYLQQVLNERQKDALTTLEPFAGVDVDDYLLAKTGYTGEDGLEIMLPEEQAPELWRALLEAGVAPCGLGARDTLRLEAGMLLSGQDMDENTTPLESALSWSIAWQPDDRDFVGKAALLSQKKRGVPNKLVGLILKKGGVMRAGCKVLLPDGAEGVVTSGSYSPTLECSIAFARVPTKASDHCVVDIRGHKFEVQIVKPRFVKHGQSLIG